MLKLAPELSLPVDSVTQTFAILAKRRSGKSFTARRFAEELLLAHQQVVMLDPKGDQWGIRSSADGKLPGFPVIILGGEHGDLPLEVNAGEVVAKLVVHEQASILLDLSDLRKGEVARFMGGEHGRLGFLEALYRFKAHEQYRSPVMLIVDEADAIGPQRPFKGQERMLGALEDIVRRGGQRGLGCMLVTQRSAVLNKNLLTQAEALIAMRTIAPQDLAAMEAWIDVHGTPQERAILLASLPSLPTGDAWFWSPGWPSADGIFKRTHISPIRTFDSGATPEPGKKRLAPKSLADIDLDVLKRQMAETIERAKADNPVELRKQIAELRTQLAKIATAQTAQTAQPKSEPINSESIEKRIQAVIERTELRIKADISKKLRIACKDAVALHKSIEAMRGTLEALDMEATNATERLATMADERDLYIANAAVRSSRQLVTGLVEPKRDGRSNGKLAGGKQRMLIALAQKPGLNARQLGLRAGLSSKSGTFATYLAALRTETLIEGTKSKSANNISGARQLR